VIVERPSERRDAGISRLFTSRANPAWGPALQPICLSDGLFHVCSLGRNGSRGRSWSAARDNALRVKFGC
jgi:hypothetical protein